MPNSKYFRIGYAIIIVLVIIMLATKVDFIFHPLGIFFETLFFPFLISGVLFYLLRPIVFFLHDRKVPKTLSILLIYLLVIGLGITAVLLVGPELQKQTKSLIDNSPKLIETMQTKTNELKESQWFSRFQENEYLTVDSINTRISEYFKSNVSDIGSKVSNAFGMLTSIITVIVTVPFIVFYLLKDGEGASSNVLKFLPYFQAEEAKKIVRDMDSALSSYIQGQAIVSFIVGVMMYIGYLIIGLDYSLILAFIAMLTNVIPFIGPFIAIVPALAIAFMTSPFMALKVVIVAVIVQQIDGNVSSPLIMGRKLDLHPLTIILLLLVAGNMAGLVGMIVAVPVYAVLKVIASHAYRLYLLRKVRKDNIIEVE
ncbi:AI-2E family transporter [Bacillus sp. M6-12]|uniref:AI-2E family transporter n=1 Tax=Bacillus sp. M6-12 TaxID=2054166 RepID=UPI000C759E0B|nr:AI-2E family transporter [Bacillus sp. M6-12]